MPHFIIQIKKIFPSYENATQHQMLHHIVNTRSLNDANDLGLDAALAMNEMQEKDIFDYSFIKAKKVG